jgi:NAD(P)-dependent dehydrogenase (short-subunit alcohol dehydrogenase family)
MSEADHSTAVGGPVELDPAGALDFSGQVVVVTGGTRGLGRGITTAFLGAGAKVVVCGRHEPAEEDLPRVVHPDGERVAVFVQADVREADQARALIDVTTERLGRLDVLVNNAGGSPYVEAADASPRFFSSIIALNLIAAFSCAQAANTVMQGQPRGGSICNISSVSGVRATPGAVAYGAAKAGLANITQTLAVEWAPKVRVNCIVAGLLDTGAGADHYGGEEGLRRVAATVPLGRMGGPADIAGACLFLSSPLASYVSGSQLLVHGAGEWPAYLRALQGLG